VKYRGRPLQTLPEARSTQESNAKHRIVQQKMVLETRDDIAAVETRAQQPKFPILYSASRGPRERTNKLQPSKQDLKRCKPTSLYARSKTVFPSLPNFSLPKGPILCSQRNNNKVVIQEYSNTSKNKRDTEIKESDEKCSSRSRCNASRPTFVCVFQTEREGERLLRVWTLRSVLWIETRRFEARRWCIVRLTFWGLWLEFETELDGAIDEMQECRWE